MSNLQRFYGLAGKLSVKALNKETKERAIRYAADYCHVNLNELRRDVAEGKYKPVNEQQSQPFSDPVFQKRK